MTKFSGIVGLLIILFSFSCSRKLESLTPSLCPSETFSYHDFSFIDNHNGGIVGMLNCSTSFAKLSMSFSEIIEYNIVISNPSGAQYIYSGKGNAVNLNWYGNSSNGIVFKQGDLLTCRVSNNCYSEPLGIGYLTLTSIISYNTGPWLKLVNFEDAFGITGPYPNNNIKGSTVAGSIESSFPSPQGGNYLHVEGQCPSNSYYFGGLSVTYPGLSFTSLGTNPDAIYLNIYVKGVANSQCQLSVTEKVFGESIKRKFLVNATPDWKLSSIKLRDIGIIDPSQIKDIEFSLGTIVPALTCSFDADLILFTYDKPL